MRICILFVLMSGLMAVQRHEPKRDLVKDPLKHGKQILQRAQRAMGGTDKLTAVKDVTHKMEIALEPAAGGFTMKQTSLYIVPNHIRQVQEMPFGRVTIYSDGESGWLATPQGVQPIPLDILTKAKGVIFRQPSSLILSGHYPSRSVKAVGENAVNILTADGQSILIQFDSETGLPERQIYTEPGANGSSAEKTEIFSDWRNVGGIKMPYKAVQQENGVKILEVTVLEYRINTGITAKEISKRP